MAQRLLLRGGSGLFGALAISSNAWASDQGYVDPLQDLIGRLRDVRQRNEKVEWPKVRYSNANSAFSMWFTAPTQLNTGKMLHALADSPDGVLVHHVTPQAMQIQFQDGLFLVIEHGDTSTQIVASKDATINHEDVLALVKAYEVSMEGYSDAPSKLEQLGAKVYFHYEESLGWDDIGGYEGVKEEIRSSILLPLQNPTVYDAVMRKTRTKPAFNRPRAVLFQGPPGCGKTSCARIVASQTAIPLVYVPLEAVLSKWYGESEKMMASIFDEVDKLGDAILFLDEIDSIGFSRGSGMHEASRRMLSVLLQRIEGFESKSRSIVIGATNRKQDLDSALMSRFDLAIMFPAPNEDERYKIFKLYAKQLTPEELKKTSQMSNGLNGRDIKDICAHAERSWATSLIQKGHQGTSNVSAPPLSCYLAAIDARFTAQTV